VDDWTTRRFWSKVSALPHPDGCRIWTGGSSGGQVGRRYASFYVEGVMHYCARLAYELKIGPVPDGYVVRQLCGERMCVNPEHLMAVSQSLKAKQAPGGVGLANRLKTTCPEGHPYTLIDCQGRRRCRPCRRQTSTLATRKYRAKMKE